MSRRIVLWAQRRAYVVPAPVRRLGSGVVRLLSRPSTLASAGPSEDWSRPLVAGRPAGDISLLPSSDPTPKASALSSTSDTSGDRPTATVAVGRESPLCAVAIDYLDVGGMDEFVSFLGRRLPEHGIRTVVCYGGTRIAGYQGDGGRLVGVLEAHGVPTVRLTPLTAPTWLGEQRPDVISSHCAPNWLLEAAVERGIGWVETLHGMHSFLHPQSWAPERERATKFSAQIAVSELVRRQYLHRNPQFPPDRIVTVPNGVDEHRMVAVDRPAARAALGLEDEFLFVSLARYSLQKNTYGLVSAFAELASEHADAHLLLAGRADDPVYYAQVDGHARSIPAADRIHLRGHCMNPAALLTAADAFVLDSYFEGWSLASMEALAAGLPVVMADVGGAREQLGDGDRGYLVGNPGGQAELVDWSIMSESRFRAQGNQADLVSAMSSVMRRRDWWAARRPQLAVEARESFRADHCLRGHAAVLRAVAAGAPVRQGVR